MTPTIDRLSERSRNNFTIMRVLAALTVLVSHSWPLLEFSNDNEPMYQWVRQSMGAYAVAMFFAISGFLIAASWDRRPRVFDFLASRCLRIFPGLFVVLVLVGFVLGPMVTSKTLAAYFSDPQTWTYVPRSIALYARQDVLPGVFEGHVYEVVNASLWSLAYEMTCYVGLLGLGVYGILKPSRFGPVLLGLAAFVLLIVLMYPKMDHRISRLFDVGPAFLTGMTLWIWRTRIRLNGWVLLVTGVLTGLAMHYQWPACNLMFPIWTGVASIWLAYLPLPTVLARIVDSVWDCSYGIYIYAFPIQQTVIQLWPDVSVTMLSLLSIPPTLVLAMMSWKLIEHPALNLRKRLIGKTVQQAA